MLAIIKGEMVVIDDGVVAVTEDKLNKRFVIVEEKNEVL